MISEIINKIGVMKRFILGLFIKDTWKQVNECDVLILHLYNDSFYKYCGKGYGPIIDSFGYYCERNGLNIQTVARPVSLITGQQVHYPSKSCNQKFMIIVFLELLIKLLKGKEFAKKWGDSEKEKLWFTIMIKAQPKIVVSHQPDQYICRAGKKAGVPVYDLQHGVIDDENKWYGKKYRIHTPLEELPDGFLCWDNQSTQPIEKWAANKNIRTIVIGNPWFLRFIYPDQHDQLVQQAITPVKSLDSEIPVILVSLQWGMRKNYPDTSSNGVLMDALEKVIIDTIDMYNWNLRLHPVQIMGIERESTLKYLSDTFGEQRANKWLESSQIPLPVTLLHTNLHITHHSSIVIEATWMGVRSGILDQTSKKGGKHESYYAFERSIGMAEVLPDNPEAIKKWIVETLTKGRAEPTLKNTIPSLNCFINEIIKKPN